MRLEQAAQCHHRAQQPSLFILLTRFAAITDGPHRSTLASIVDHELFIVLFLSLAACLARKRRYYRLAVSQVENRNHVDFTLPYTITLNAEI